MGTLLLAGVALVGVLLVSKRGQAGTPGGSVAQPPPPPPPNPPPALVAVGAGGAIVSTVAGAAATGSIAAIGAATVVVSEAGDKLGRALTGNSPIGVIAGRTLPVGTYGAAGIVGATVGRELDMLLGGTGSGARSYIAQVAGVLFFVGASFFGFLASVVYSVFFFVDDLNRQAWKDDGGPEKEFIQQRDDIELKTRQGLQLQAPTTPEAQLRRFSVPFADGYQREFNRLAYARAMELRWGIGATRGQHARHQYDRGYWVGGYDAVTGDYVEPAKWPDEGEAASRGIGYACRAPSHMACVPVAERVVETSKAFDNVAFQAELQRLLAAGDILGMTALQQPASLARFEVTKTRSRDAKENLYVAAGAFMCNAVEYTKWMGEQWGLGQSEVSHGVWGRKRGQFSGYFVKGPFRWEVRKQGKVSYCSGDENSGYLEVDGVSIYWKDEAGDRGPFVKVKDV